MIYIKHKIYAKKITGFLVTIIEDKDKMYYSRFDNIKSVSYPYKYKLGYSRFSKQIAITLGIIGDALYSLDLPYLQSLVMFKNDDFCGRGYKKYSRNISTRYEDMSDIEKKQEISMEHKRIRMIKDWNKKLPLIYNAIDAL